MNKETQYLAVLLLCGLPPKKPEFHEARDNGGLIAWDWWAHNVHNLAVEQGWVDRDGFGDWFQWCEKMTVWFDGLKALS